MKQLLKHMFSGEFFFVLFLFSGYFKMYLPSVPIDWILIFALLTFLVTVKRIYSNKNLRVSKNVVIGFGIYLLFGCILLVSLMFSDSVVYGREKVIRYFLFTSICFLVPIFLINNKKALTRFSHSLILVGVGMSIGSLFWMNTGAQGVVYLENYGNIGRSAGLSLIASVILLFFSKVSKLVKFYLLMSIAVCASAVLISGARMALLASALLILVYLTSLVRFSDGNIIYHRGLKYFAFALIPFAIFFFMNMDNQLLKSSIDRLMLLTQISENNDPTGRLDRYILSYQMLSENPIFGKGVGTFALEYTGLDERDYAHNIFFEILGELGIVGFMTFCVLLALVIFASLKSLKCKISYLKPYVFMMVLLMVYMFFNANVMGDINDNRIMFTFFSIILIIPSIMQKELSIDNEQLDQT